MQLKYTLPGVLFITVLVLAGCKQLPVVGRNNPDNTYIVTQLASVPAVKAVRIWQLPKSISNNNAKNGSDNDGKNKDTSGLIITTRHYEIYTTLKEILILQRLAPFMEFAWLSYADMAGAGRADMPAMTHADIVGMSGANNTMSAGGERTGYKSNVRLKIYLFASRKQWEAFTYYWAGSQAGEYLQIKSGAYYLNGACVAYNISRRVDFSILAHEGWHQFSHIYFRYYLPAWLDEGIATNFEAYKWQGGKVVFNAALNGSRLKALQISLQKNSIIHLGRLLTADASMAISNGNHNSASAAKGIFGYTNNSANTIDADTYYAQVYALVRFLREYHYGMYRAHFQKMLTEARLGHWKLITPWLIKQAAISTNHKGNPSRRWNAAAGTLIFRQYFNNSIAVADMVAFDAAYMAFCQSIVFNARLYTHPN